MIWEGKKKRYKALKNSQSLLLEEAYQRFLNEQVINPKVNPRVVLNDGKLEVDFNDMIMYKPNKQVRCFSTKFEILKCQKYKISLKFLIVE